MPFRLESHTEPLPGYKLVERLGQGGFGEVWKAEAPGGILKAIKFVFGNLENSTEDGKPAEQELRALSRVKSVRHPFILSLERYDVIEGQLIIVMELADRDLWDRYKECRTQNLPGIPRDELLGYMEESAEALDLMNTEYQLQHLDIKPQNLFLVRNHIKVADFGLVKDFEGVRAAVTGGVTPVYAAPETFDGWVSRFSDQYSLAIVYQELLTGQRPIVGSSTRHLILQHMQAAPNLVPLPECDRPAIGRALSKNPPDRFPSCSDLVQALRSAVPPASDGRSYLSRTPTPPTALAPGTVKESSSPRLPSASPQRASTPDTSKPLADPAAAPKTETQTTDDLPFQPLAPAEVHGNGILMPALIVGLGGMGRRVVQRLRAMLQQHFGSLDALPHLRFLGLDSDPDEPAPPAGRVVPPALETLVVRLHRPSYYLKPRDGIAPINDWFNPRMLFRIPRTQVTTGLRALGRLAFFDHVRPIAHRLRAELDACLQPEALARAERLTRLGVRTNRPRVYVITSLGGGTGSGMFIDLAYMIRDYLHQLGYEQPEVRGLFMLPALMSQSPRGALALGNAYAALTELNHFSSPEVTFAAQYFSKQPPVRNPDPPFSHWVALPMLRDQNENAERVVADLAGGFLYQELVTPLGRVSDACRAVRAGPPARGHCQTFGLYRFTWPRRALIQQAARRLGLRLVRHWIATDGSPVRDLARRSVAEQWVAHGLESEILIERLRASCEEALGVTTDAAFASLIEWNAERGPEGLTLTPASGWQALAGLENLLAPRSRPARKSAPAPALQGPEHPTTLAQVLNETTRSLVKARKKSLAEMTLALVEHPAYRLAGAEEALRHFAVLTEQASTRNETLAKELGAHAAELRAKILAQLNGLQGFSGWWKRKGTAAANLTETLRQFAKSRYQALVLTYLNSIYRDLRQCVPEYLREVGFNRSRLGEITGMMETLAASAISQAGPLAGRLILPAGCRTFEDAVRQLVEGITHEELVEIDHKVQTLVEHQYKSLHQLCVNAAKRLRDFTGAVTEIIETFLETKLGKATAAQMYLDQQEDDEKVLADIIRAFGEAVPELEGPRLGQRNEVRILAVHADEAGSRFRDLARRAAPEIETVSTVRGDDILFYREQPYLPLADLPQLGPQAREAYQQVLAVEHCTPHSRTDITDWRPATAE